MSDHHGIADDLLPLAQPIGLLKLLPGNPRRGDVQAVARSYERFGQRKPVVARRDGTVIAGNHQLQAAQQLGWSHLAVVWTDDDDTTAKAFALADNRLSELGGQDEDALQKFIEEVAIDTDLLAATGYDLSTLDSLIAEVGEDEPDEHVTGEVLPMTRTHFLVSGPVGKHSAIYERLLEITRELEGLSIDAAQN